MTEIELLEILNTFQQNADITSFSRKSESYWPFVKVKTYFTMWEKYFSQQTSLHSKLSTRYFFSWKLLSPLLKIFFQKKVDVALISNSINHRVHINNSSYDIFLDPIMAELSNSSIVLEYNRGRSTTSRPTSIAIDIFYAIGLILSRIVYTSKYRKRYFLNNSALKQLENELHKKGFHHKNFIRLIDKSGHDLFFISKIVEFILHRTKAKLLILTDWYSTTNMAAILASKRLHMYSIDIQHGVQGEYHVAYGGWIGLGRDLQTLLPTHFWVWQQSDQTAIQNCTGKNGNIIWGGIPFLAKFEELSPQLPYSIRAQYEHLKTKILNSSKKSLLITLQSGYETLPSILDFIKKNESDFYFLFRLHHSSAITENDFIRVVKDISAIKDDDFNIRETSKLPIYSVMQLAEFHMTYNSSSVIEFSLLGKPSAVLDLDLGAKLYQNDISSGMAMCSQDAHVLRDFFFSFNHSQQSKTVYNPFPAAIQQLRELLK